MFLNLVQQGNTLIIQDANVSGNYQTWLVSGTPIPNTGSGYVEFPITLTTSGGSTNFANNHQIILAIIASAPAGATGPTGDTGATGPQGPAYAFSGGQFYKTGNQTTVSNSNTYSTWSGSVYQTGTDITLDSVGGTTFTVNTAGIYQLEWMFSVQPGNSTWTNVQKVASVDITRSSTLYNVIQDTRSIASTSLWCACLVGSLSLNVGDVISCRVVQPVLAGGTPTVAFLQGITTGTVDNNTSFTYRKLN